MKTQVHETVPVVESLSCYHCGQHCEETLWIGEKSFCCYGCKTVFEILHDNDLCEYYSLDKNPGTRNTIKEETFAYLDEPDIRKKVVEFDSATFARVQFYIPAIHCASCIWLLEHLERLDQGIIKSEVNFSQKTIRIDFNPQNIKLGTIAYLLGKIGYDPQISLEKETETKKKTGDHTLLTKLALAGFCFGNIMLFSFPEYFGLDQTDAVFSRLFSWLNLALAVPVFFYSAGDYFRAALTSFRQKQINIDVPIALGLLALFTRSTYDIITGAGPGYFDSFSGLVFFLLTGRWFQSKTYESLAFDRDFKSYFPLAVNRLFCDEWKPVVIYNLRKGDQIRIRNREIIPADSILLDEKAYVDYSFVTGESKPVKVHRLDLVYAGGRLIGQPVTLVVDKKISQSHLTSLWNHDAFRKIDESQYKKIIDRAARKFTWIVLVIALITSVYWYLIAPAEMWLVITSVLMVACPCALALAAPFTYGSMLRVFGRHQLYLKNADVIERLASIDTIVFDKTGTVTTGQTPDIEFVGELTSRESGWIKLLTSYSTHPLSSLITKFVRETTSDGVNDFKELPGKGIEGNIKNHKIRIGSPEFTGYYQKLISSASLVFVAIDDEVKGYYTVSTRTRKDIKPMLDRLGNMCSALLSGDNDADRSKMAALFSPSVQLLFNQSPHDKLHYIRSLQEQKKKVLMIGDGLNDAGALKQSDVGIAITDDTGVFTPACDGILKGDQIATLDKFLMLAKTSTRILKIAFMFSFLYNAIALAFAVTGNLTPLVAAVLMPVSSISVVGFSSLAVKVAARKILTPDQPTIY